MAKQTPEIRKKIRDLRAQGFTMRAIAEATGKSTTTVFHHLKNAGFEKKIIYIPVN